jgi:FkbM family methyltransferase
MAEETKTMEEIIKQVVIFLKRQVYRTGYQIKKTKNFVFLDSILLKLLDKKGSINFIQIGANDGKNDDPLHHFIKWNKAKVSGYVLEPVKEYYAELQKNYSGFPTIKTLNLAIHNSETEMIINRVSPQSQAVLPPFVKGIASFKKEHHIHCKVATEHIVEEKVDCISLENLMLQYNITTVDLLQIDTEGYDAEIILNIDFKKWKPSIINFEYYVPNTMSKETFTTIIDLLHANGYEIWMEVNDITAYQRDLFIKMNF